VARRHDIVVPSLVADVRVLEEQAEEAFEEKAFGGAPAEANA
jgi:hypothetical protein